MKLDLLCAALLLIYIVFYQITSFPIVMEYSSTVIYLKTIGMTIVGYVGFFLCGIFFYEVFQDSRSKRIIIISWWLFSLFEIFNALKNHYGFYIQLSSEAGFYLILADSYAYISLFVLSAVKTIPIKIMTSIVTTIILSALLSRASLICFISTVIIFIFFSLRRFRWILSAFILFFTIIVYINSIWISRNIPMNPRLRQLIELKTETPGFVARMELLKDGMKKIEKNIFGDFMGEVRDAGGETGSYIHNIVSYARQYGIFPFLALCSLLFFLSIRFLCVVILVKKPLTSFESFCLLFSIFNSLLMITSRGYTDPSLWLQVGLLSTGYRQRCKLKIYYHNIQEAIKHDRVFVIHTSTDNIGKLS